MEYHNDALKIWQGGGLKDKILVHIDAHIDFGWIADEDPQKLVNVNNRGELESLLSQKKLWDFSCAKRNKVNIGNYIYPAIREGIVKEFYWVVPDPVWASRRQRRVIKRLKPQGINVHIMPLASLPSFEEPVLLDIDTDYFVTYSITDPPPYYLDREIKPWISPRELVASLKQKGIKSDCITIAYSVDGGFTPIEYGYLGDELARLFDPSGANIKRAADVDTPHKNKGRMYFAKKEFKKAKEEYLRALSVNPDDVHSIAGLADVFARTKNYDEAQRLYARAVELNSNPDAYYGLGLVKFKVKDKDGATAVFKKLLDTDPNFAPAHYELGKIYKGMGRIEDSITAFRKARNLGLDGVCLRFTLADLYRRKGNMYKARREFGRALRLTYKLGPYYLKGLIRCL